MRPKRNLTEQERYIHQLEAQIDRQAIRIAHLSTEIYDLKKCASEMVSKTLRFMEALGLSYSDIAPYFGTHVNQ